MSIASIEYYLLCDILSNLKMSIEKFSIKSRERPSSIDISYPSIIAVIGKAGVGKTTFAEELAKNINVPILSSDIYRRRLFASSQYQEWHSKAAYEEMFKETTKILANDSSVILDATFSKLEYRNMLRATAELSGRKIYWVEIVCSRHDMHSLNINGVFVERNADQLLDIADKIVINNSFQKGCFEEPLRNLIVRKDK